MWNINLTDRQMHNKCVKVIVDRKRSCSVSENGYFYSRSVSIEYLSLLSCNCQSVSQPVMLAVVTVVM